jgi:non-heme Fe2+,alpha-ketoglutarate-dependent halogenase
VPWHQDASFWKLSPARTVTVWLAIDDADAENAAMRFIPGTHDKGEIETVEMGEGSVFHKGIANAEQYGEPFVNALKAGQMSLHADMLLHGSDGQPLGPAALRADAALLPAGGAHHRSRLGAGRGGDHRTGAGHVGPLAHHPRPENDDILATSSPHVVGNN